MLVLTRKTNESIVIGDDIEVSVLAVSRDKIRIGISAPKEVSVYRKEVWLSIQEGNKGAVDGASPDGADGSDEASHGEIEGAIIDGAAAKVEKALGRGKS